MVVVVADILVVFVVTALTLVIYSSDSINHFSSHVSLSYGISYYTVSEFFIQLIFKNDLILETMKVCNFLNLSIFIY